MRSGALCTLLLLIACHAEPPRADTPASVSSACGLKPSDWCPAAPGDPCGEHRDKASCMADPRCVGVRYRGESLVACHFDDRGFADNCPTVGCVRAEPAR